MSHQVLARKWRPKNFASLVGQEHVTRALSNALDSHRIHHAYLFTGTRGVGKTTIARILAKSLNCETGISASACCQCHACLQIDAGNFIDLLEIDAASNTGVDHIREILEDTQYAPTVGRFKIYIIDEAHMLSKSAFNALLKTLEEPPEHIKFILATTDPHKLPVTILSRCLCFNLRNMTMQQISQYLQQVLDVEKIAYEKNALNFLARAAEGSMRDALSLLDQAIAYNPDSVDEKSTRMMLGATDHHAVLALLNHLTTNNAKALVESAEALITQGINPSTTLSELALLCQQLALLQAVPDASIVNSTSQEDLTALAHQVSPENVQLYYQIALHGKRDLALAPDEQAGFIMTLLRMLAFCPIAHNNDPLPAETLATSPQEAVSHHQPMASITPRPSPNPTPAAKPSIAINLEKQQLAHQPTHKPAASRATPPDRPLPADKVTALSIKDTQVTNTPTTNKPAQSSSPLSPIPQLASSTTKESVQKLEAHKKNQQKACETLEQDPVVQTLKEEFGAVLHTETAKLIQH